MNGAGNDFIILNNLEERISHDRFPDIARILCDNFEWLSVYKFCGKEFQRFRQVAVLGIRKPRDNGSKEVLGLLRQVQGAVRKTLR